MLSSYNYKPLRFYLLTFVISWISWFLAIYISYQESMQHFLLPLTLAGLSGPALSTLIMLIQSRNKDLWNDFFHRLRFKSIKKNFLIIAILLFPFQVLFSITISLFFGQSVNQFSIIQSTDLLLQSINFLFTIFIVFLVGPFEEIGWHGYGTDSLLSKFNLFKTSLIFGAIWGLWHVPLFFVHNGAFQEIWNIGLFHTFLYFLDLFLLAIILNWFYIKNNRSILITIIFHSVYDIYISIVHITPVTFIILTIILFLTSAIIIQKNKNLFFKKDYKSNWES